MSNFQQWASGDTAPWTKVNENFEAMAGLSLYAFNKDGSSGLVYGLMGGIFKDTVKAATTTTLADNTTNYVVANLTTGAITDATTTTNWDDEATYARVAKVTTSGGQITAVVDYRHDEFGLFSLIGGAAAASSSAAAFNSATAFDAFGDSITDGTGASSGANEYVSLIASGRGWTATNHGTSGDMVADHADDVFAESIGDGHQCTLMLGTNDQRTYTTNTYRQGAFKVGHMALAAWLAIPEARKQKGQGRDSVTGTWTNNAEYGGALGIQSIVPASTATFTTYGTVAYVCTILQNAINATFTVSVDGVVKGTYQCMPGNSTTITSVNGRTFMPALIRIPGLSEGSHSVVITVGTASSGNPVYVLWVSGNQGHRTKDGPNLWVGNVPRFTSAGYVASGGSDAVVAIFNDMIRQNVETLAADGLNVALVDSASRLNPSTDLDTDGVHPDDSGHAVIAQAFLEAINQIQKPRTMGVKPVERRPVNQQTGTTYKLVMADVDKSVRIGNAGAQTLTIPTNVEVPFELGTLIPVAASGAGALTLVGDTGVTVNAPGSDLTLAQYERGLLLKVDALTWDFVPIGPSAAGSSPVGRHMVPIMAAAMQPSVSGGCGALASVASGANQPDIVYLPFDATTQEYAQFAVPMPKSWNEGTVTFQAVWSHPSTTTNFGVVWDLQAVALSNDDAMATAYGTAQTSTDTGGTTDDQYVSPESSAITVGGSPAAEDLLHFRVSRVTGNGSDTMAVDARLMAILLYITTDAANDA